MKKQITTYIYSLLVLIIGWTIVSGRIGLFLHPRMRVFLYIGWAFLILLCLFNWYDLIQLEGFLSKKKMKLTVIIPYALFFIVMVSKPTNISADALQNKSTQFGEVKVTTSVESTTEEVPIKELEVEVEETVIEEVKEEVVEDKPTEKIKKLILEANPENDLFLDNVNTVYENPEAQVGNDIVLEGFVFRSDGFQEDILVVGRLMITCCAADSSVVGIYVQSDEALTFETDSWIRVEGIVASAEIYDSASETYIEVYLIDEAVITQIEAYEDEFVYWEY